MYSWKFRGNRSNSLRLIWRDDHLYDLYNHFDSLSISVWIYHHYQNTSGKKRKKLLSFVNFAELLDFRLFKTSIGLLVKSLRRHDKRDASLLNKTLDFTRHDWCSEVMPILWSYLAYHSTIQLKNQLKCNFMYYIFKGSENWLRARFFLKY